MGAIYSRLAEGKYSDVPIELNPELQPAEDERLLHTKIQELIGEMPTVMDAIDSYSGCSDLCRIAMTDATPDSERAAFEGLILAVASIQSMFEFSTKLAETFPLLLEAIFAKHKQGSVDNDISIPQALIYQVCQILQWVFKFDQTRMMRPVLINDFSYYRRWLAKFRTLPNVTVREEEASRIQMFAAQVTPMTSSLIQCTKKLYDTSNSEITQILSLLANSCCKGLKAQSFQHGQVDIAARAMTSAVLIFDHVDDATAFSRKSPINIKGIINVIKKDLSVELMNICLSSIKYSTKNVNDAPESIQNLLEL